MKKTEELFKSKTYSDSKSILNKLNRKVDQSILDKIEAGVTLEDIDKMIETGLPILKYHTQITIHGVFNELKNNYIFAYKNIFQNKNMSIGVKYNAIDEEKRIRIAKRLRDIGMHYTRNSQSVRFSIQHMVDKKNFEDVKTMLFNIKNSIDESLYFGNVSIWVGEGWGVKYLCLDLSINAIYEKNIEKFLNGMGATKERHEENIKVQGAEQKERDEAWRIEAEERKAKEAKALVDNVGDLDLLAKFNRVTKCTDEGTYLLRIFNYNDRLIYKIVYIYSIKGKKKNRYNKTEYSNINQAMNHKSETAFSDGIYSGKVTGYKLN